MISTEHRAEPQSRLFLAALMVIFVALAACWFIYDSHVTTRKAYLIERNFRLLSEQGKALSAVIANYENIFQSILQGKPDAVFRRTRCVQGGEVEVERKLCIAPHIQRVLVSESEKRKNDLSVQFAHHEVRLDYVTNLWIAQKKASTRSVASMPSST